MTNYEHWMHYLSKAEPPPLFAKVGFYYMISTALQRRVWIGDEENKVFPNLYVVLTATAGGGKGLVTSPINSFLGHHLLPQLEDTVKDTRARELLTPAKEGNKRPEHLFPCAPSSTTKESLGREMANCIRTHVVYGSDGKISDIYQHNSLHFNLDELESLFNDESSKMTKFLLSLYTCNEHIRHETIGRGSDYIAKSCLSLIGGITPQGLIKLVKRGILTDGFLSRSWFVYDTAKPLTTWVFANRTPAEKQSKQILLNWLLKLSTAYGQVTYGPDVNAFMNDKLQQIAQGRRANSDNRLDSYYQRYQLHLQKAVMSVHFSKSLEMEVTLEDAMEAAQLLEDIEKPMSKCFIEAGRNEVAGVAEGLWRKMLKVDGRVLTEKQVRALVFMDIKNDFEFKGMIQGLIDQGKLIEGTNPMNGVKMYQAQEL